MGKTISFVAGVAAGLVLAVAVAAHADWNDPSSGSSDDRRLLERIARSGEESARHLGELARSGSESARAQAATAQAVASLERACR